MKHDLKWTVQNEDLVFTEDTRGGAGDIPRVFLVIDRVCLLDNKWLHEDSFADFSRSFSESFTFEKCKSSLIELLSEK